ncbi:1-deoxy-D-xylulose-5-phosphate reductoisomerase, partial [Candidatus Pelagibacter sp.]|nr:1-deoxy-D-xylulose-5-phosphate reductoisomerase [Candidatus Pelagibacter sp.]
SGIDGLGPTLKSIKYTEKLGIANKESIICGWKFIKKELKKNNTKFIPLDSEHFSIWSLIRSENKENIKKIYLTASGGPFLNKKLKDIKYIKPKYALMHPNWKMGKKITIDSATMMNKIFEIIEAKKIFNINNTKLGILIHPKSHIHAIVHFKTGLTKFLAHETTMEIPILNALYNYDDKFYFNNKEFNYLEFNGLNFLKPNNKNFPLLKIMNYEFNDTYFEIILVILNDTLVSLYLKNLINYISIHKMLIKLLKNPYFSYYYDKSPKNINEIENMVKKVKKYLHNYFKLNEILYKKNN